MFSILATGEAKQREMVNTSRKEEWGATMSTGAAFLAACLPRISTQKPSR